MVNITFDLFVNFNNKYIIYNSLYNTNLTTYVKYNLR